MGISVNASPPTAPEYLSYLDFPVQTEACWYLAALGYVFQP
jgi:hypothetical protein